jgi:cell division protein FtsZ
MHFEMLKEKSSIIKVIGVGGGGGNAVNHMYKQGITGVDFIICNTDAQALELSPIPNKVQLGASLTEGMGAGSIPEVGKNSAIENIDDIKQMLGVNTKMLFITAGMGGGTGTGASPIIAKAAREMDILTVGIITTPFSFEGKRRKMQAEEGMEELKKYVDSFLVISNDRLRQIFGNLTMSSAFAQADDILTTAAKGIAEIITLPGYINVDFKDVRTVMKDSGVSIMGSSAAEGENRALKAVEGALSSPLLKDNEIEGARYILLNISSGEKEVTMDEVSIITDYIQEEAGLAADLIWGNCKDESLGEKISVTIIATGFQTKDEREQEQSTKKIVSMLVPEAPLVRPVNEFITPVSTNAPVEPYIKGAKEEQNQQVALFDLFGNTPEADSVLFNTDDI